MRSLEDQIVKIIKDLEEEKRLADKRTKQLYDLASGGAGIPVGAIVPYLGGYFTNGSNGGFTMMMAGANTVAALNTLLNGDGWYVCNGAALNLGGSPIFNGAGRYLPLLTDDRFIMGDTLGGTPGGNNVMAHTHVFGTLAIGNESAHTHGYGTLGTDTEANHGHGDNFSVDNHTLTVAQIPSHTHGPGTLGTNNTGAHQHNVKHFGSTYGISWINAREWQPSDSMAGTMFDAGAHAHTLNTGTTAAKGDGAVHSHGLSGGVSAGGSHSHAVTSGSTATGSSHNHGISGSTGAASETENRPKFLGCFYIMRVV